MMTVFDPIARSYDQWYESEQGRAIFEVEMSCLRSLCPRCIGRWLEVGVGTGRFAAMLGIGEGIDPSPRMLDIAAAHGIKTYEGCAEALPFSDSSFDGLLLALALCFVADPEQALKECRRVLRKAPHCSSAISRQKAPGASHTDEKHPRDTPFMLTRNSGRPRK